MEMPIKIYLGTRDGKNLSVVPEGYPGATEYVREEAVKSLLRELNKALRDKEEQMKLQKEPVSEDLELASERYACKFSNSKYGHDKVKDAVVWGANWQKEQMLKDAISCKVFWHDMPLLDYTQEQQDEVLEKIGANVGDKVKLIIIKED